MSITFFIEPMNSNTWIHEIIKHIPYEEATIDACDFIVTTSNVTAHIAGGLGKDVYLIVPASRGKIWYWHEGDTKSLWYPSINQFQIKLDGLLEAVMEDIKSKIKKRYL